MQYLWHKICRSLRQKVSQLPLWIIAVDGVPFENPFLLPLAISSRFWNWAKKESKSLTRRSDFSSVGNRTHLNFVEQEHGQMDNLKHVITFAKIIASKIAKPVPDV